MLEPDPQEKEQAQQKVYRGEFPGLSFEEFSGERLSLDGQPMLHGYSVFIGFKEDCKKKRDSEKRAKFEKQNEGGLGKLDVFLSAGDTNECA